MVSGHRPAIRLSNSPLDSHTRLRIDPYPLDRVDLSNIFQDLDSGEYALLPLLVGEVGEKRNRGYCTAACYADLVYLH